MFNKINKKHKDNPFYQGISEQCAQIKNRKIKFFVCRKCKSFVNWGDGIVCNLCIKK